jgi:glycosyltransferase involved in cell wall biosynthesis
MKIVILMSYHNNMHDTVKALQSLGKVTFLTTRPVQGAHYLLPSVPLIPIRTWRLRKLHFNLFSLFFLWRHLPTTTDLLIIKHLYLPRNLLPLLIALLRGIRVINLSQSTPNVFEKFLLRLLPHHLKAFSVIRTPHLPYLPACVNSTRFTTAPLSDRSSQVLKIISIAKFQPRKNLHLLLTSLHELQQTYPALSFHLTIIGTLLNPTVYQNLCRQEAQLKLSPSVTFATNLSHHQTLRSLEQSDIFVLPANREPLGYSVVEAMACGLPVIVTQEVGSRSYLRTGQNGFVIPPGSSQALTQALQEFIKNPQEVDRQKLTSFGVVSRFLIMRYHTPEAFLKKFEQLL